jgi:hypothetical protein
VDVRRHDRGGGGEGPLAQYEIRPQGVRLLARLVEGEEGLRQRAFDPAGGAEEGGERRHVDVVAAGVHQAVRGGEGRPRLLAYGEGVELGPHRDGRKVVRPGARHEARACDAAHLRGPETLGHEPGGLVFFVARLGARVQPLAQGGSARELRLQGTQEGAEGVSRHAGTARRPLSVSPLRGGRSRSA